jgi:alcohol dehydrogenase (cytochrome c)
MVLADQVIDGQPRKLVVHADRNGMFYVLDRTNGKFLFSTPFVRQTWNLGFDPNGRPIVDPRSVPDAKGTASFPLSATNFGAPSYDKDSGLLYVAFSDSQSFGLTQNNVRIPGQLYIEGTKQPPPEDIPSEQGVKAIDSRTGAVVWTYSTSRFTAGAGVLGTRGGVVFASTAEGSLIALDAKSGRLLWSFNAGVPITASPISYAVDGQQFVAVSAGNLVYSFALPEPN